ncbi:MAG: hypothetical protein WDN04_14115 [Rhodospirillales bacterium]
MAPDQLQRAIAAVTELMGLWDKGASPTIRDVLRNVARSGVFEIPDILVPSATREENTLENSGAKDSDSEVDRPTEVGDAIDKFLDAPFSQLDSYKSYVSGTAPFDTHQGVKGLQLIESWSLWMTPMPVGFLFSYEKLFGAKEKTKTDLANEREGKETTIDRTRRLFYVTCSRAKKSLALIAYSSDPHKVRNALVSTGWFDESEVQIGID